jgi:hypothetical protein
LCFDGRVSPDREGTVEPNAVAAVDGRAPVSDWQLTEDLLRVRPTRWGSLSWTSARTLIDAVNQLLSFGSADLVGQLREQWVTAPPDLVHRPDDTTFMIIGDTGEQDASQYVVAPGLSDAVRAHHPGFVLIMSDVMSTTTSTASIARTAARTPTSTSMPRCWRSPATTTGTTAWPASCTTSATGTS